MAKTISPISNITSSAEGNKKKLVVVSVVGILLIAVLLLFLNRGQFAGKAIYADVATPALSVDGNLNTGGSIVISAVVGSRTMTGATFDVRLPVDCQAVTITDRFGGLLAGSQPSRSYTCTNSFIHFDDGILVGTRTAEVPLLEITFPASLAPYNLQFTRFEVVDGDNIYTAPALPAAFACGAAACRSGMAVASLCGTEEAACNIGDSRACTTSDGVQGYQQCNANCDGFDESCNPLEAPLPTPPPTPEDLCGNGQIDAGEECEDTNLNGKTCIDIDPEYAPEGLRCNSECRFDSSECRAAGEQPLRCTDAQCIERGFFADVNVFCALDGNEGVCRDMCEELISCPEGAPSAALRADLNGDNKVDNTELFIIKLALFAKDSEPQQNCGAEDQPFCYFRDQGYYVCENLEFIQVISGDEAPAAGQLCGGAEHITGRSE